MIDVSAIDLDELLPHGPAARLVGSVVELDAESVLCRASAPVESPYGDGDTISTLIGVEMAAQAAAVHQAVLRIESGRGPSPTGFVVRARKLELFRERLEAPLSLLAGARLVSSSGALCVYHVACRLEDGPDLLTAALSILHGPDR